MTSDEMWKAITECDEKFDGVFFLGVKTTGIFCRPSCRARTPLRKNVDFYDTASQALDAGFRPCKRCRPDLLEYQPVREIAEKAKNLIDGFYAEKQAMEQELKQLGITRHRMVEIFKERFGVTINEYINAIRLDNAKIMLTETDEDIVEIAYSSGFESLSTFYRVFNKHEKTSPALYRKINKKTGEIV